jgi:sulfite reductase alpha subunit-like flavoprotein
VGDPVALFFRESSFHLPLNPAVPVIMICGGAGIAPFASFLEERLRLFALQKQQPGGTNYSLGPAVLYYGCKKPEEYMFRDELLSCLESVAVEPTTGIITSSVLSRVVVAFSSALSIASTDASNSLTMQPLRSLHAHEDFYPSVQNILDVVAGDAAILVPLVKAGACIYVCGGQGHFGNAVRNAVNIIAEQAHSRDIGQPTGMHSGLRLLIDQKRYFEDLAD